MTGHVAQGATVDRAFVLASEGMSREWAYVALSRGRLSNRLYVAAQPDDERAEFAPVDAGAARSGRAAGGGAAGERRPGARDRQRRRRRRARRGIEAERGRGSGDDESGGRSRRGGISGCRGAGASSTSARERERAADGAARRGAAARRRRRGMATRRFVTRARAGGAAGRVARADRGAHDRAGAAARARHRAGALSVVPKTPPRPVQPVPRFTLTRKEAAASLGISLNHFERRVQPELKVVLSGQLVLIPVRRAGALGAAARAVPRRRRCVSCGPAAPDPSRGRGALPPRTAARRG